MPLHPVGHEPLLAKGRGSLRFDIVDGEQTEQWFLTISKGDVAVSRDGADPTGTIRASRQVFESLTRGESNAMASALRGETAIEGDVELVLMFSRIELAPMLMPSPVLLSPGITSTGQARVLRMMASLRNG